MIFRIRWKGYMATDDTWETADCFVDPQFLQNYLSTVNLTAALDGVVKQRAPIEAPSGRPFAHFNGHSLKADTINGSLEAVCDVCVDQSAAANDNAIDTASSYSYDNIRVYRDDWKTNRSNWRAVRVINERKKPTGNGKELLVLWQHVRNDWQSFHSWEAENSLNCYDVILKYYCEAAKATERNELGN